MAVKINEDDVLRFLRFSVVQSAAATYTESEFSTNLSIERGVIWQVHELEVHVDTDQFDTPAASALEKTTFHIARESKTAILNIHDADTVFWGEFGWKRSAVIGTDAGPLAHFTYLPQRLTLPKPYLYAGDKIYVGVQSTYGAAVTVRGRLAYTLAEVTERMYYRVAQALLG